jgi:hypothetical protein
MKHARMERLMKMSLTQITLAALVAVMAGCAHKQKVNRNYSAFFPVMTLLFVQNAQGVEYDADSSVLTLDGVSPVVTFFSDRPGRYAGHLLLPGFIEIWGEGEDSFAEDPPNAALSIFDGNTVQTVILELADPSLKKNRLTYRVVQVLEGELPASGGTCSLFIDDFFSGSARGDGMNGSAGDALIGSMVGVPERGTRIGVGVGVSGRRVSK